MKFSYNWLAEYFSEALPEPKNLADLLIRHSFEVDGIEALDDDFVIEVDVLPNRAHDCLGHAGLAHEVAVITGLALKETEDFGLDFDNQLPKVSVKNEAGEACRRYLSTRIEGVKIGNSSGVITERLKAFDGRPINDVVDMANYAMFDVGQPLHVFDADKVEGGIIVRYAKEGESMVTLDGQEVSLTSEVLVIADEVSPLAIAGVKGGQKAEVTAETKNLILESANFSPTVIRRASGIVGIRTDASKRFENGLSAEWSETGIRTLVNLILQNNSEAKVSPLTDIGLGQEEVVTIKLSKEKLDKYLGFVIAEEEVKKIFERLRFDFSYQGGIFEIRPSSFRLDLRLKEDIIEEIIRIYGYDNVPNTFSALKSENQSATGLFAVSNQIRAVLLENGFSEFCGYTFSSEGAVEIDNPLTTEKGFLRTDLKTSLLVKLEDNLNHILFETDPICLFEIGNVFPAVSKEETRLAFGVAYRKAKFKNKSTLIKDAFEKLNKAFSITEGIDKYLTETETATMVEIPLSDLKGKETTPKSLTDYLAQGNSYQPISPYPRIVRDISLFVDSEVLAGAVIEVIKGKLNELAVIGPVLFDEFVKDDKKSLAFRIVFQAPDRTLSDEEVNDLMAGVYGRLTDQGWEIR